MVCAHRAQTSEKRCPAERLHLRKPARFEHAGHQEHVAADADLTRQCAVERNRRRKDRPALESRRKRFVLRLPGRHDGPTLTPVGSFYLCSALEKLSTCSASDEPSTHHFVRGCRKMAVAILVFDAGVPTPAAWSPGAVGG